MKTRKQVDRLFREQLKNLEVNPPKEAWENIAAALKKEKENRRVVPLWYKLAGVAAALLLFVTVGSIFFSNPDHNKITIEDDIPQKHDNNTTPDTKQKTNILQEDTTHNTEITSTDSDIKIITNDALKDKKGDVNTHRSASSKPTVENQKASKRVENTVTAIASKSGDKNTEEEIPAGINKKSVSDTEVAVSGSSGKEKEKNNNLDIIPDSEEGISEANEEVAVAETNEEAKEENKKSLLEYIAQKEETEIAQIKTPENRWEVSPNFAPVYYNTLGDGSSIDPEFSSNPKSGDVNYSYGVQVSYAINNKLSVRTGLNKVDLSYVTNDIEFAPALPSDGLQSVTYKNSNYIVAVGKRGTLKPPASNLPTMTEDGVPIVPRSGITPGSMTQQLDYFEIPVELKYALLESRIGVNLIGGMSTLLLNNNEVSIASDGFSSTIGSANNLNNFSFSTNIGFGLDYKLSKRFIFNLEPMFKYQINPYSDSSIDFKPYYLGVYSGFSYRF
tara:strand:- start:267352 stop:268857 length:1506 start_codon:yes stop_codon:yes gene_type:complete